MKTFLLTHWRPALLVLTCLAMLGAVVRVALAGPATDPRAAEEERARREIAPPAGYEDLRLERPEGDWIGALGVIEPAQPSARLVPGAPGRVAVIHVDEGDRVNAGAPLVELESAAEEAALAAAEAEVAAARAELARVRRGVRREDAEARAQELEAARARAELAAGAYERLRRAAPGGAVSEDALERARRRAEAARAEARRAAARRRAARRGRPEDVRLARARLAAARARRDEAAAALARRRIVAPFAGEVLEVLPRVGEHVAPGGTEPVVVLGDTRSLRARVDVDERDVARVAEGSRALVTVDALPGERFEGRVVSVARRMGRKNVRSDEPTERIDTKILEVVVALDPTPRLVVGQRVMAYLAPRDPVASGEPER